MSITEHNFSSYLTILTLAGGELGALVLHYLELGHYSGGYPLILIYFYILDVSCIYVLGACRRHASDKMATLFLVAKVLKMIISVFLSIIYRAVVPDSAVEFLLTLLASYLSYLIYESWFFSVFEWSQKLKKKLKKYEAVT